MRNNDEFSKSYLESLNEGVETDSPSEDSGNAINNESDNLDESPDLNEDFDSNEVSNEEEIEDGESIESEEEKEEESKQKNKKKNHNNMIPFKRFQKVNEQKKALEEELKRIRNERKELQESNNKFSSFAKEIGLDNEGSELKELIDKNDHFNKLMKEENEAEANEEKDNHSKQLEQLYEVIADLGNQGQQIINSEEELVMLEDLVEYCGDYKQGLLLWNMAKQIEEEQIKKIEELENKYNKKKSNSFDGLDLKKNFRKTNHKTSFADAYLNSL